MRALVESVDEATLSRAKDGSLSIHAVGTVPTLGYTDPRLGPVTSHREERPSGGVYVLDFTAQPPPPDRVVGQQEERLSTSLCWTTPPGDLRIVRVRGRTNARDATD